MSDRAVRALEDVVAVEMMAPGMVRVVTWADQYVVDARDDGCYCPDKEYNLGPDERCKHEQAAILADLDHLPTPYLSSTEERRTVLADGGDECEDCAELPEGWPCANCFIKHDAEITAEGYQ